VVVYDDGVGGPVSAGSALGQRQVGAFPKDRAGDGLDDELGHPVAAAQRHGLTWIEVDQVEFELSSVARIDRAR